MNQDIRQSPEYSLYMESVGWTTGECEIKTDQPAGGRARCRVYIRNLPFLGPFLKILRPNYFPLGELDHLAKKYHVLAIQTNYSPTRTLRLDLVPSLKKIESQTKKDCRYEIRKAQKYMVIIRESHDIEFFIKIWHKNALRHGFWIPFGKEIRSIYKTFGKNAHLLFAYSSTTNLPISGAIILIYDKIAYYFHAASTAYGRTLSAPYLVVWEAIKLSKKKGCQLFDFEGILDPRDKNTQKWGGFTHFKKSFGGEEVEFPLARTYFYNPILKFFSQFF